MTINIVKSNKVNYTFPKHMTKLTIIDQKEKKNDKTNCNKNYPDISVFISSFPNFRAG